VRDFVTRALIAALVSMGMSLLVVELSVATAVLAQACCGPDPDHK
jgi:hypothetical protein